MDRTLQNLVHIINLIIPLTILIYVAQPITVMLTKDRQYLMSDTLAIALFTIAAMTIAISRFRQTLD